MAISFTGNASATSNLNRLTLTGGTSGSPLTPSNIINDANAWVTNTAYAQYAIVKYDNGDGWGLSLWSANAAISAAATFTASNWTRRAAIQGTSLLWVNCGLDIGAYFRTSNWSDFFFTDYFGLRCVTGCKWDDNTSSAGANGLSISVYSLGNNGNANTFMLASTDDTDYWRTNRMTIKNRLTGAGSGRSDICLSRYAAGSADATMQFQCDTLFIDTTALNNANNEIRLNPTSVTAGTSFVSNIRAINNNAQFRPNGLSGIAYSGLPTDAQGASNKVGILAPAKSNPLVGFAPNFTNYTNFSLIGNGQNQAFLDTAGPSTFNPNTSLLAYYRNTSCWLQRTVELRYSKAGVAQPASVLFAPTITTTGSPDQNITNTNTTTDGDDNYVLDWFYGQRSLADAPYAVFDNRVDARPYQVLVRNPADNEVSTSMNLGLGTTSAPLVLELTSITDPNYTNDQSGATGISAVAGTSLTVTNNALTVDNIYDWTKWWVSQTLQMVSVPTYPFSVTNGVMSLGAYNLTTSGGAKGTKMTGITTTGNITLTAASAATNPDFTATQITLSAGSGPIRGNMHATASITQLPGSGSVVNGANVYFGPVGGGTLHTLTGDITYDNGTGRTLTGQVNYSTSAPRSIDFGTFDTTGMTISNLTAGMVISVSNFHGTISGGGFATVYNTTLVGEGDALGGAAIIVDSADAVVASTTSLTAAGLSGSSTSPIARILWGKSGFNFVAVTNPGITVNISPVASGISGNNPAPAWTSSFTGGATPAAQIGVTNGTAASPVGSTETYQRLEFLKGGSTTTGQTGIPMLRALNQALINGDTVAEFFSVIGGVPTLGTEEIDFVSSDGNAPTPNVQRFITGIALANGVTFGQITSDLGNSAGNPQVVNVGDPQATLGVVVSAVEQATEPSFGVINRNVQKASLLIPASENLPN